VRRGEERRTGGTRAGAVVLYLTSLSLASLLAQLEIKKKNETRKLSKLDKFGIRRDLGREKKGGNCCA